MRLGDHCDHDDIHSRKSFVQETLQDPLQAVEAEVQPLEYAETQVFEDTSLGMAKKDPEDTLRPATPLEENAGLTGSLKHDTEPGKGEKPDISSKGPSQVAAPGPHAFSQGQGVAAADDEPPAAGGSEILAVAQEDSPKQGLKGANRLETSSLGFSDGDDLWQPKPMPTSSPQETVLSVGPEKVLDHPSVSDPSAAQASSDEHSPGAPSNSNATEEGLEPDSPTAEGTSDARGRSYIQVSVAKIEWTLMKKIHTISLFKQQVKLLPNHFLCVGIVAQSYHGILMGQAGGDARVNNAPILPPHK